MGTPQSSLESLTSSTARMASLVFILLLPLMAAAAPKNQERGFLGDLITGPVDLAQCMGKCPLNPLEFAKCSVECAKGSEERGLLGDLITGPVDLAQCMGKCPINPLECAKGPEEKNRGLMGDLAACVIQCKLNPDGTCNSGPLGLPKPCSLINLATDVATG